MEDTIARYFKNPADLTLKLIIRMSDDLSVADLVLLSTESTEFIPIRSMIVNGSQFR